MKTKKQPKRVVKKDLAHLSINEKYRLYEEAVQNPENDIEFINLQYKRINGKMPKLLREDFCGTGFMACEWAKQSKEHFSCGLDLDQVPLQYGIENHFKKLTPTEQKRVRLINGNVLKKYSFKSDAIVAFNFSYFIFKKRNDLLNYFKSVKRSLNSGGIFCLDLFGGTEARQEFTEKSSKKGFKYYWDCHSYNPLTEDLIYYIHFEVGKKRYERAFTYEWRMWGAKELEDILKDAGFKNTQLFWEGDDGDGGGDGNFYPGTKAENCESWVTYLMAY
jgi:SAM-dependent methyltransferase